MVSTALVDRSYRPATRRFSLDPAAAQLYEAFARVPAARTVAHCAHCVSTADIEALQAPVAGLPPELVARFVRKFGTTWGTTTDLRRVTPRVLTLAADHRLSISTSLIWEQMRAAQWTTWPSVEVDAIGRFLLAEFSRLLRVPPRPAHVAHRWLAQVTAGVDDISGFLTVWNDSIGALPAPKVQRTAAAHLVELLTSSPLRPDLPATIADVFPSNARATGQLSTFLTGPSTDIDLRRGADAMAGTASARRASVAVERLRRFRSATAKRSAPT